MFDMSWGEVMVIGGVALIVIGPKDLPKALRTVGQMTTKVRRLASEFQSQFNEAMREAELEDVRKEVEGLNRQVSSAASSAFNPIQTIRDELKGAIDTPPVYPVVYDPASAPSASSDPGSAGLVPVAEEAGPIPQIEPAPSVPHSPPDAPALPPRPVLDVAGPGLEQASEDMPKADLPKSVTA